MIKLNHDHQNLQESHIYKIQIKLRMLRIRKSRIKGLLQQTEAAFLVMYSTQVVLSEWKLNGQ